jgi:hypothetical protein
MAYSILSCPGPMKNIFLFMKYSSSPAGSSWTDPSQPRLGGMTRRIVLPEDGLQKKIIFGSFIPIPDLILDNWAKTGIKSAGGM